MFFQGLAGGGARYRPPGATAVAPERLPVEPILAQAESITARVRADWALSHVM